MMPKLIEFPKQLNNLTYGEALKAMMAETSEETLANPVTNLVMIGFHKEDYQFGMLNVQELRHLIGTMDCVKAYLISAMEEATAFDDE
jgi:hypothetical protein